MYIAMVVRNSMEDFHCEHLSDSQMRELNPIIRNAVCTAIHAINNYDQSRAAKEFVDLHRMMIPSYWEQPELTKSYLSCEEYFSKGDKPGIKELMSKIRGGGI